MATKKTTKSEETAARAEQKLVRALAKYIHTSPYKIRQVANLVRGKSVDQASNILEFTPKEGARILLRVLNSAIANAERNDHLNRNNLVIHSLMVNEGPTIKRFRPRAQGRYGAIRKRSSHVEIVLKEAEGRM